jgi:hypothetical protein
MLDRSNCTYASTSSASADYAQRVVEASERALATADERRRNAPCKTGVAMTRT